MTDVDNLKFKHIVELSGKGQQSNFWMALGFVGWVDTGKHMVGITREMKGSKRPGIIQTKMMSKENAQTASLPRKDSVIIEGKCKEIKHYIHKSTS